MTPTTYLIENNTQIKINTLDAQSATFNMLAPGEPSQVKVLQLYVPDAAAITNIQLALIDTDNILFTSSIFGIDTRAYVDTNLIPKSFFTGVSDGTSTSPYNILIGSINRNLSRYVYLNLNMPRNQIFISGTIRYKWFFDYA